MKQVYEPIPENLKTEYASLRVVLGMIAKEKGADYHVEEWRPFYFATPFDQKTMTMDKQYQLHTFAGYKIERGEGLPEDSWRRSVLLAGFDKPERHLLPRPQGAGDDYHLLAINFDRAKFTRSALEAKLKEFLPTYDLHFDGLG